MATVPKGPGQQEVTGDLSDPSNPSQPGLYRDPESGAESEVTMPSGADALVRMGWKLVDPNEKKANMQNDSDNPQTNAPVEKLDDADEVQEQQDNAEGHKSEVIDGPPGVPAGDPEKLADKADAAKSDQKA